MNLDRELLRQYYLKNGYADVQITAANAELDRDGSGFFITYAIDEGEPYTFGTINVQSTVANVDPAAYRGEVTTQEGDTYDASRIDKSVEDVTLAVSEKGYAFARVRPQPEADPVTRKINMNYVIEEGPRVYVERINVSGNTRTKDYVIRREFRVAEGDAYNPLMVDQAKKRLKNLGLFKNVDVKRRPGSAQDRVILDVEVVEQSTGELSFGAGYSTAEGVIGDISITERNLMGNGQFLRLALSGSLERLQVDLSFTEPRFLDRNMAAGFDLFHKEVDQTSSSGFNSRRTGGGVRLGFPISEKLWMQTNYTVSRDEIFGVADGASLAIKEAAGVSYTSLMGTSLTYDLRNDPKNPTKGLFFTAGTDFAGLGGDVQYVSFAAEGARLLSDHRQDHLRQPCDRWLHHGLGRPGRAPHRSVLQGRRDGARLRSCRLWPARPADRRCARRRNLLGDDGRNPLPHPVCSRRPGDLGSGVRGCRLAV